MVTKRKERSSPVALREDLGSLSIATHLSEGAGGAEQESVSSGEDRGEDLRLRRTSAHVHIGGDDRTNKSVDNGRKDGDGETLHRDNIGRLGSSRGIRSLGTEKVGVVVGDEDTCRERVKSASALIRPPRRVTYR